MKTLLATLFLGATALFLAAAPAGAVVLDDFRTASPRVSLSDPRIPVGTTTQGSGILGGERDIVLKIYQNSAIDLGNIASVGVGGGRLSFGNEPGVKSSLTVTWDGVDNNATSNAFGLGGIDLTDRGRADGIVLRNITKDQSSIIFRVYTDAANYSEGLISLIGTGIEQTVTLLFSSFTDIGAGAKFSAVNAVEMIINSRGAVENFDLTLSEVGSQNTTNGVASEPAQILFLSLAFSAFALKRRAFRSPA